MRTELDTPPRILVRGAAYTRPHVLNGVVSDIAIADKQQVELFAAIGRTRGLFRGVSDWPHLNGEIRKESATLLERDGAELWKSGGGTFDRVGEPTFLPHSQLALQLVRNLATKSGGFIWTDTQGAGWAVRLLHPGNGDASSVGGLAISWYGAGRIIDPLIRDEYRRAVEEQIAQLGETQVQDCQARLRQVADQLWLYERAEQLLWMIHASVLRQRQALVLIPDVTFGEILWGARRKLWPENWRRNISDILWSLSQLHAATMQLARHGWQPQFSMRSVAVAHVEHVEFSQQRNDVCRSCCPLWNCAAPHGHFLIQIGYGFLGVLEKCCINDDGAGERRFDFRDLAKGDVGKRLKSARRAGRIVPVHLPTKLLGASPWAGLRPGPRRIMQALVAEVTRSQHKKHCQRVDRADVFQGNRVPGIHATDIFTCPYLKPGERHVAFNGNGFRRGKGYRLVGPKGKGWLYKSGYCASKQPQKCRQAAREFLNDMVEVASLLGITVVGIDPRSGEWSNLQTLIGLSEVAPGWKRLDQLHLRVYGPEDYLDRARAFIAERGGFAHALSGAEDEAAARTSTLLGDASLDLAVRMRQAGVTQRQLAQALSCSEQFISMALRGKKEWPAVMWERADRYVRERMTTTADDSRDNLEQ